MEPNEWLIIDEIRLFYWMTKYKLAGINKHFNMFCIVEKMNYPNKYPVILLQKETIKSNKVFTAADIWKKVESYYDLEELDKIENEVKKPIDVKEDDLESKKIRIDSKVLTSQEFMLPWDDYGELKIANAKNNTSNVPSDSEKPSSPPPEALIDHSLNETELIQKSEDKKKEDDINMNDEEEEIEVEDEHKEDQDNKNIIDESNESSGDEKSSDENDKKQIMSDESDNEESEVAKEEEEEEEEANKEQDNNIDMEAKKKDLIKVSESEIKPKKKRGRKPKKSNVRRHNLRSTQIDTKEEGNEAKGQDKVEEEDTTTTKQNTSKRPHESAEEEEEVEEEEEEEDDDNENDSNASNDEENVTKGKNKTKKGDPPSKRTRHVGVKSDTSPNKNKKTKGYKKKKKKRKIQNSSTRVSSRLRNKR